jgi:hypothetical protein
VQPLTPVVSKKQMIQASIAANEHTDSRHNALPIKVFEKNWGCVERPLRCHDRSVRSCRSGNASGCRLSKRSANPIIVGSTWTPGSFYAPGA